MRKCMHAASFIVHKRQTFTGLEENVDTIFLYNSEKMIAVFTHLINPIVTLELIRIFNAAHSSHTYCIFVAVIWMEGIDENTKYPKKS